MKEAIAAQKAALKAQKAAEQETEKLKKELADAASNAEQAKNQNDTLISENDALKNTNSTLSAENDKLKSELEAANIKMQDIAAKPSELSEEQKEEIRRQIEEKYSGKIEQLTLDAETANQRADQIATEKADLERKAAQMANSDVIKLQALFEQMQNQLKEMKVLIAKLPDDKAEPMAKLIINTAAKILGK